MAVGFHRNRTKPGRPRTRPLSQRHGNPSPVPGNTILPAASRSSITSPSFLLRIQVSSLEKFLEKFLLLKINEPAWFRRPANKTPFALALCMVGKYWPLPYNEQGSSHWNLCVLHLAYLLTCHETSSSCEPSLAVNRTGTTTAAAPCLQRLHPRRRSA